VLEAEALELVCDGGLCHGARISAPTGPRHGDLPQIGRADHLRRIRGNYGPAQARVRG
jgi:hypothetical protein